MAEQAECSKGSNDIKKLKYELGDLTYKMGLQQKIAEDETKKLRKLQQLVNDKATEIEKLDGGRDNT